MQISNLSHFIRANHDIRNGDVIVCVAVQPNSKKNYKDYLKLRKTGTVQLIQFGFCMQIFSAMDTLDPSDGIGSIYKLNYSNHERV